MPPEAQSGTEVQDPGQAFALLGVLTMVGVLAPLFAFFQGTVFLLALPAVAGVSAAGLALYALRHGQVDNGLDEVVASREMAAATATPPERVLFGGEELQTRLRAAQLFRSLTPAQVRTVASIGELRTVAPGARLTPANARAESIYVVLEGHLRLLTTEGGVEKTIGVAGAGEAVPLAALLDPSHPVRSIVAASPLLVYVIPRSRFLNLCERQPTLGLNVYRAAAGILAAGQRV